MSDPRRQTRRSARELLRPRAQGRPRQITGSAVCEPLLAEVFRAVLRAGGPTSR